jgi:maltose-binding protein MalE
LPQNQNTGAYVTPISDYKGLAITKRSRNPLLARRLVQYLTGLGVQYRFTKKVNKLPSVSAVSEIEWQESEVRKAVKRSAFYANPIPPDRAYSIYKNVMWSMIRLILDHKFSGIEGLEEAERLINVQITDYLQQLPQHYRSYYSQSEGEKNDEWEMEKTENERVDDASSTTTDRGFFTWLRSLW